MEISKAAEAAARAIAYQTEETIKSVPTTSGEREQIKARVIELLKRDP